ncbi:type IV secretion system DNA-binding domain-containing protein [Gluconacetobacter sp. 1c LMG 22058]|uniref:Type IV secretion system DNA-binding domain-containing protein n=1 Tax=Gluconacetobacter dulcium TaxID=2729096 RepID=A0A7W4K391_9PROT|nr:type IV secretion system DNA-binding domain-containing protein [Gluconacetobacter dulcium]MBB2199518.1 type IV secretion system DNA-binding domain-containing protein [Gluconacetobacter dulcium]
MAVIRRQIDGPQDFHEQAGGQSYRDTRRLSQHVGELLTTSFSAVGLIALAILTAVVPALTTLTLPMAAAYAAYVMTRPVTLPLRLPANAGRKDYGNPVPDPKRPGVEIPGPPTGDWLLGWDEVTGQQIWLSGNDLTMHGVAPGATGSGKTQLIYSLLCNALAQGTGFTIVDGKASNNLPFTIMAMARRWGQEANVRIINLMVSGGDRRTNTWNMFASVNAEGMTELFLTLFVPEESKGGGGNSDHFRNRAESLIRGMAYVFEWVRDNLGVPITSETVRTMFSDIDRLRLLYSERRFSYYDADQRVACEIILPDHFPTPLLNPVRDYVSETGGFSDKKDVSEQDKVREQHSYVVGGFGKTFTQMSSTLGHVFGCNVGDIDFRDIIYNRRILVVLLPSLENHPDTNRALGKAVITALRYALAAALGTSIEGDYEDLVANRPSSSKVPYPMVLDEVGQFATRGIDSMMALGRELNVFLLISFQEVGTLYATLGRDFTVPLLGNPKLKILMNVEDAGPTRQWIEESGGTMPVTVLPGYDNSSPLGLYADQQRADIREVKRVSWSDIQKLRQGQAIILFRGRRIYARLFYAGVRPEGVNRVFPTLPPTPERLASSPSPVVESVARHIAAAADLVEPDRLPGLTGGLRALYSRLAVIVGDDASPLQDAEDLFTLNGEGVRPASDPFAGLFRNLIQPAEQTPETREPLDRSVDQALCDELVAFEMAMGASEATAKGRIVHALNLHARGTHKRRPGTT